MGGTSSQHLWQPGLGGVSLGRRMKTYPILKDDGSLHAFEVTSSWVTFRPLYRILASVDGVSDIKRNWFNLDRVSFKLHGEPFVVHEPWGDNSRYWIGPKNIPSPVDLGCLHAAFQQYEGPIARLWGTVSGRVKGP